MNSSELRIGNYVKAVIERDCDITELIGRVSQISEVKGISGRELVAAGAETAVATIRVWTRFRSDITAASRLRVMTGPFKGAILNIIGPPIPDSRGIQLEILCKQGTEK